MSDTAPYAADWETKIAFMRARGLASAKWTTVLDPIGCKNHEVLSEVVCGPPVLPPTDEEKYAAEAQPSRSPQEKERIERQRRRDLASRSSGGPVLKPDAEG
jgi:hypothetical protein